jgi:hypothetical protein
MGNGGKKKVREKRRMGETQFGLVAGFFEADGPFGDSE